MRLKFWLRRAIIVDANIAIYLAVAESLNADPCTGVTFLATRCRDIGLAWVRNLAEIQANYRTGESGPDIATHPSVSSPVHRASFLALGFIPGRP
jgi:hypothetical protein